MKVKRENRLMAIIDETWVIGTIICQNGVVLGGNGGGQFRNQ
jgi:hypothetical protein